MEQGVACILRCRSTGSYFDLDMHMLESGYMYGIKMSFYNESVSAWVEQPHIFKFRVEK